LAAWVTTLAERAREAGTLRRDRLHRRLRGGHGGIFTRLDPDTIAVVVIGTRAARRALNAPLEGTSS
jgi:hypothetical protein